MTILLFIILIISLIETGYLLIKIRKLKKRKASDSEYEKMVKKICSNRICDANYICDLVNDSIYFLSSRVDRQN